MATKTATPKNTIESRKTMTDMGKSNGAGNETYHADGISENVDTSANGQKQYNSGFEKSSGAKSANKQNASTPEKSLETLFEDLLKDTYSAEKQLLEALPNMAKSAYSEDLEDAFHNHLQQTKRQVERLEKVFSKLRIDLEEKTCEAMKGLIKENETVIKEYEEGPVRDSALIIGSQKVEHYEIAAYGSLCELADVLGHGKIMDILSRTLQEEEDTDKLLSEIAMNVNDEAYELSNSEAFD